MNDSKNNPFVQWRRRHPHSSVPPEINNQIAQWLRVTSELLSLLDMFDKQIEPWLDGQQHPLPNLFKFIEGYGYTRIVTANWTDIPIVLSEEEREDWDKNSGLLVSMKQLRDYQAGVTGSVVEILSVRPDEAIALLSSQVSEKLSLLSKLVTEPIDSFRQTQWSGDQLGEEVTTTEIRELDTLFDTFEALWCFVEGCTELRLIMISEHSPEFSLPSQAFFDALSRVDIKLVQTSLVTAEPKLREVLRLWSSTIMSHTGNPYHRPYDSSAPEEFWWRHKVADVSTSKEEVTN